jgi:hypothetical protein
MRGLKVLAESRGRKLADADEAKTMRSRSRGFLPVAVAVVASALVSGCAARVPFTLKIQPPAEPLVTGGEQRVEAVLANTGRRPVRFTEDAKLRYSLSCRRAIDAPGQGAIITGTAFEGGVWGGITDVEPDPDDPLFCRSHPPATVQVAPGGTLALATTIETPRECIAGEAELEILFTAPDFRRRCPGIWYGETPPLKRNVRVRHAGGDEIEPTASPSVLQCSLSSGRGGASLRLTLRNSSAQAWRASVVPSIDLAPEADPDSHYWAPLLTAGSALMELDAGAASSREIALGELRWTESFGPDREVALEDLPAGRYTASLWMEVVGGKSWELRCPTATVDLVSR